GLPSARAALENPWASTTLTNSRMSLRSIIVHPVGCCVLFSGLPLALFHIQLGPARRPQAAEAVRDEHGSGCAGVWDRRHGRRDPPDLRDVVLPAQRLVAAAVCRSV